MKIIKENINNYKDPLTTVINTTEADAIRDDKKTAKDFEDILDPMKLKKKKPFTGADKQKGPDQKDLPSKLENKLTEDVDYDARPYENRLLYLIKKYYMNERKVFYELVRFLPDIALRDYVEYLEDSLDDDLDEDYNYYEVDYDMPNDYAVDDDANDNYGYLDNMPNDYKVDDEDELYAWEIRNTYDDSCILSSLDIGDEYSRENDAYADAVDHLNELSEEESDRCHAVIMIFNPETGDYEDCYSLGL